VAVTSKFQAISMLRLNWLILVETGRFTNHFVKLSMNVQLVIVFIGHFSGTDGIFLNERKTLS